MRGTVRCSDWLRAAVCRCDWRWAVVLCSNWRWAAVCRSELLIGCGRWSSVPIGREEFRMMEAARQAQGGN
eukprot:789907-Pyramimonas_sp.AAC.1